MEPTSGLPNGRMEGSLSVWQHREQGARWPVNHPGTLRPAPVGRNLEAAGLAAGTLAVVVVLASWPEALGVPPALLCGLLPVLLWAAIRFGFAGTAWTLIAVSLPLIWHTVAGSGPFASGSAAENALSLQLYLLALPVPLLILAATAEHHQHRTAAPVAGEADWRREFAQLATVYRTAPVGLAFVDAELRFVSINDRLAEFNGCPAAVHRGRTLREVVPDLAPALEPLYRRVLQTGAPVIDQTIRGAGASATATERDWLASYYPVRDDGGRILGVSTVLQEVTELRKAEAEIGSLLRRLRDRVKELTALHRAARLFQDDDLSTPEWLWQLVSILPPAWQYPEIGVARVRLGALELATPGFQQTEWRQTADFLLADGQSGSLEVAYLEERPAEQEGPFLAEERSLLESLAEMLRLAIDRRESERTLRESEERYRSVVEHQTELVCRFLPDTTLTFANEAYCRHYGKSSSEVLGRQFLELIPESARAQALEHVRTLACEPRVRTYELEVNLTDGSVAWQQWVDQAILDDRGSVLAFQAIGRDITERRRAEEALREREEALRQLTGRLLRSQDEERRRIARELHDTTAQEVFAMTMNLARLQQALPDAAEKVRRLLEESGALGDHALREIRTLSYLLHPPLLDQAGLVSALRWYVEGFTQRSGIAVDLDVPEQIGRLPTEVELALFRIVQEALANVHRHSGSGTAAIRLTREARWVVLRVADAGRGMPAEASAEADQTMRRLGVGIPGMRERLRQLGGHLEIQSGERGTVILAGVPAQEGEQA